MAQLIPIGWLLTTILAFTSAKSIQREHGYGVLGGELAKITELPHQVYIKRYGAVYCGGSIVSPQHILTAKDCIDVYAFLNYPERRYYTVVAATADSSTGGDEYAIANLTTHSNYTVDLLVLKLAKEIKLSEKAKPIALAAPSYEIIDGAELIASGWGEIDGVGTESNQLRKVTISKVSDDKCENAFEGYNIDHLYQFCAGGEGEKTCLYDDGGPLVAKTRNGNVLVGVMKLGFCYGNQGRQPSLFTKVSQFSKWIKEIIKEDSQSN